MRHLKSGRKFSRTTDHRKWLMRNLVTSLLESGRITTTEAKAKELRRHVDRLITAAKPDDLAASSSPTSCPVSKSGRAATPGSSTRARGWETPRPWSSSRSSTRRKRSVSSPGFEK